MSTSVVDVPNITVTFELDDGHELSFRHDNPQTVEPQVVSSINSGVWYRNRDSGAIHVIPGRRILRVRVDGLAPDVKANIPVPVDVKLTRGNGEH